MLIMSLARQKQAKPSGEYLAIKVLKWLSKVVMNKSVFSNGINYSEGCTAWVANFMVLLLSLSLWSVFIISIN